jgi:hypothetical protein
LAHGKKHDESGLEFHGECSWFFVGRYFALGKYCENNNVLCDFVTRQDFCVFAGVGKTTFSFGIARPIAFDARKHTLADSLLEKAKEDHIDVIGPSGLIGPSNGELQRSFFEGAVSSGRPYCL